MAITYPVSPDSLWTVYKVSTSEAIATRQKWAAADGGELKGLDPDYTYLLEQTEAKPTYDSATHKIEKTTTVDVPNNTITQGWTVTALTQAEIDERIPAHVEINGIKWKTDEASQAAFSSMTLLLDKAGMADTDMVAIKDAHNVTHPMTVQQYQADALQYGLACYQLFHS